MEGEIFFVVIFLSLLTRVLLAPGAEMRGQASLRWLLVDGSVPVLSFYFAFMLVMSDTVKTAQ